MIQWLAPRRSQQVQDAHRLESGMSSDALQFRWILVLCYGLADLFRKQNDILVASGLPWHAAEGMTEKQATPDVMVVFGRPREERQSYLQWKEQGIAPQVIFDVVRSGNTFREVNDRLDFYEEQGVEEQYIYLPEPNWLGAYVSDEPNLRPARKVTSWVSARLGIRFDLSSEEMTIHGPDGRRFLTYEELLARFETEENARTAIQRLSRKVK